MQVLTTFDQTISLASNFNQVFSLAKTTIQQAPLQLAAYFLEAVAFSFAISYAISYLLSLLHFQYANFVAESKITKLLAFLAFWYFKISNQGSWILYLSSIFGMVFVSTYAYDCCWNISQGLQGYNFTNRELVIIVSFSLMLGSSFVLYQFILKNQERPLEYEMLGIYILIIMAILIGNFIRQRTILNTILAVLFMNYLIVSRHYNQMKIPFHALPFFLMGLDAQKKQRKKIGGDGNLRIFRLCLALAFFGILRNPTFPLEMVLGAIFIFGLIINR